MKKNHIASIACFSIALLLYLFAGSDKAAGGFGFIGCVFELMGWRKALQDEKEKDDRRGN